MSENSKIEWTDSTWNFLVGCDKVSAGCKRCYAIQTSWIRQHNPKMKEKFDGVVEKTPGGQLNWTGRVNISPSALMIPLKKKKPTKYFVNSLSDLFHENVPFAVIDKAFAVMAIAMQHTFQILTKREKRMLEYFNRPNLQDCITTAIADMAQKPPVDYEQAAAASQGIFEDGLPLVNVHIGVSCEDQKALDERLPYLLQVPAAVRFLSCEPLLGPIEIPFIGIVPSSYGYGYTPVASLLHWVIVGGESGKGARPMHPDWARSLRDQCSDSETAFLFKQWGEWAPTNDRFRETEKGPWNTYVNLDGSFGSVVFLRDEVTASNWTGDIMEGAAVVAKLGKKAAGRLLDGRTHDEFPNTKR